MFSWWSEPHEADALYFQDGSWDGNLSSYFNMNTFLDTILTCVLQKGGKRRIVFSCFDPDICTMWVSLAAEEHECLRRLQSVQEHIMWQCSCWVAKTDDSKLTCCWTGFLCFSSGCAISRTNTPSSSSLRESQACILSWWTSAARPLKSPSVSPRVRIFWWAWSQTFVGVSTE